MKLDLRPAQRAGLGVWTLAALAAAVACNDQIPPPSPASFSRPQRVAFTCFDTQASQPVAISKCAPDVNGLLADNLALHALVTQSDRGEVAAVDLRAQRVIDSRSDIPGYTFVPAGELPGAIAISPLHPTLTYVANTGSRDISVLNTADFRNLPVRSSVSDIRVPVRVADDQPSAAPFDMLMIPEEDALFVSAPESGLVLRIPIKPCVSPGEQNPSDKPVWGSDPTCGQADTANIQSIPIGDSFAKAPMPEPPLDSEEPYGQLCGSVATLPIQSTGNTPQLGTALSPQPAGLALDAFCSPGDCQRRLLVADKALPIVHVIDIDALAAGQTSEAVLPPIVTGVPTERVAVSPRVPIQPSEAEDAGETQYVYAIDANDGSVLVTQNGRVLDVSSDPATRSDRLDLGRSFTTGDPVALSLEVMTPRFDPYGPGSQWIIAQQANDTRWSCGPTVTTIQSEPDRAAAALDTLHPAALVSRLRGVFLAVGLTDGTVRVIDVHDMELAECRSCDVGAGDLYQPYPLRRHRQRIGAQYVAPSTGNAPPSMTPVVTPTFEIGATPIFVNSDGTTNDPRIAGLDCISCPEHLTVSFPPAEELVTQPNGGVGAGGSGEIPTPSDPDLPVAGGGGGMSPAASGLCGTGQGRICSLADPWVDPLEWFALFEGELPGTRGGHGRFVADGADSRAGEIEFSGEAHFCESGVLGDEDIGDPDGNGMQDDGDQLAILSNLLDVDALEQDPDDDVLLRSDCEALIAARDDDLRPIAFRIKRAYADHLVLAPTLLFRPSGVTRTLDSQFVQRCFQNMLMTYDVRTLGSYLVQSTTGPGFMHRVKSDPASGRCVIDGTIDPKHDGRAYDSVQFDNGYVSFKTLQAPAEPGGRLHLIGSSLVPKLVLDASTLSGTVVRGVMPVDLRFNPLDEQLYIVDIALRGLIPVPLDSFPSAVLTSYQ